VAVLGDALYGVERQLETLPRDDTTTALLALGLTIVDGTSDEALLKGEQLPRGQDLLLLVVPDGPTSYTDGGIKGEYSHANVPVAITVVHRGARTVAQKHEDCYSVLRAVVLALKHYFTTRGVERRRNEVTLLRLTGLVGGLVQDDGAGGVGAITFNVEALDKRAQPTY
jgi:hypothetical protein